MCPPMIGAPSKSKIQHWFLMVSYVRNAIPFNSILFSLIVLAGAVQLRRLDSIKPALVLVCVFPGSASNRIIRILMPP